MLYYAIRRKKDYALYGRNPAYKTTGNNHPRHGFDYGFPPFLYKTLWRAEKALERNEEVKLYDCEIVYWNTKGLRRV